MCLNLLPFSSKSIFKVIVYLTLFSSNEHRLFEIFSGNIGITVSLRYVELPLKSASLSILLPISKNEETKELDTSTVEGQIIKILETKIRPAVARDGGDIKFQEFKDGKVKVLLKGSCSGCPSSTLTLKKGVENLLCHYIPEVKEVLAV